MPERRYDVRGDVLECLEAYCLARETGKPRYKRADEDGLPHRRTVKRATVQITKSIDDDTSRVENRARTGIGDKITGISITIKTEKGFTRDKLVHMSRADKGTFFYSIGHTVATVNHAFEHAQAHLLRKAQLTLTS